MARRRGSARRGSIQIGVGVVTALALAGAGTAWVVFGDGNNSAGIDNVTADGVRAGQGPAAAAGQFIKRVEDAWSAADRIEQLEQENRQLKQWRDTALALSERMERYEALLRMPPESLGLGVKQDGVISARLILDAGGPFKRTMLANAGADHGVHVDYVVVNENGLVGRVVTLGKRSSRVLLVDDFNSRIPVMGLQSRVRAVLSGDTSAAPELFDAKEGLRSPRLDHQVPANAIRDGEAIVTSGDGGIFPRGIFVGVAEVDAKGQWRVRLGAARAAVDYVRMLPFARVEAPEVEPVDDPGAPTGLPAQFFANAPAPPPPPPKRQIVIAPTPAPVGSADDDAAPPAPEAAASPAPAPSPPPGKPPQ